MPRSKWKGPYLKTKSMIKRNSKILPQHINNSFLIHNGKTLCELAVTENMIGHKFGEFVFTRKKYTYKKK